MRGHVSSLVRFAEMCPLSPEQRGHWALNPDPGANPSTSCGFDSFILMRFWCQAGSTRTLEGLALMSQNTCGMSVKSSPSEPVSPTVLPLPSKGTFTGKKWTVVVWGRFCLSLPELNNLAHRACGVRKNDRHWRKKGSPAQLCYKGFPFTSRPLGSSSVR